MKILIFLLRWALPFLLITDLTSEVLRSEFILNISRSIRVTMLILFIMENIRFYRIMRKFYFYNFFMFFILFLFIYLLKDENFTEGFWGYSKILFWVLGLNVLYAYNYKRFFILKDYIAVIKKIIIIGGIGTVFYFYFGNMEDEYNVFAYLILFTIPSILFASKHLEYNKLYILIAMFSILITFKRGAIIAMLISIIIYFLSNAMFRFNIIKTLKFFVLGWMLLLIGYGYFGQQSDSVTSRYSVEQFDIENENAGSGSVGLYSNLFYEWYDSDVFEFSVGFGNQADLYRNEIGSRIHAHSDILGFLYNYGIIGMLLILALYFKLIKFYIFHKKKSAKKDSIIIMVIFSILVPVNFYSGVFGSTDALYLFALLPYLQLDNNKNV